jgi:hypothetical protein
MANLVWRKKASNNLKKKWDSGEMEHARKTYVRYDEGNEEVRKI